MNIILLSGGSGKRLWPLSNGIRSKQFLRIFKKKDGTYESMVQRMYHGILKADPQATITIATSREQHAPLTNQLGRGSISPMSPAAETPSLPLRSPVPTCMIKGTSQKTLPSSSAP